MQVVYAAARSPASPIELCFPFHAADPDGTNRRENITDWALKLFRDHYHDPTIEKWDIFYYVYGVLHHPAYREKFADNLKRELPRIPLAPPLDPNRARKEAALGPNRARKEAAPDQNRARQEADESAGARCAGPLPHGRGSDPDRRM